MSPAAGVLTFWVSWSLVDIGPALRATVVFSLFGFVPGYVAGWIADIWGFRGGSLLRQAALSVVLSISTAPIAIFLVWRFSSVHAVWWFMAAVCAAFIGIVAASAVRIFRQHQSPALGSRALWIVAIATFGVWALIALLSLPDLRVDDRLYYSVTAYDHTGRIPVAVALSHAVTLPPPAPHISLGQPVPLPYHYLWLMICGLVQVAGGSSFRVRDAVTAGAVWGGFELFCVIAWYVRFFQDRGKQRWRPYAIAFALVGVGGLDILPVLALDYVRWPNIIYSVSGWNEQVNGWIDAMLWVPHNLAALAAGLAALLLLLEPDSSPAGVNSTFRPRWPAVILAAAALASTAGMAILVAAVFGAFFLVWFLYLAWRREFSALPRIAATGVIAVLLASPFLLDVMNAGSSSSSRSEIHLWVRPFSLLAPILVDGPYAWLWQILSLSVRLAALPLNYLAELGVFLCAGILWFGRLRKRGPLSRHDAACALLLGTSLCLVTFVFVGKGSVNDLGMRGFLPAQLILLLWTAQVFGCRADIGEYRRGLLWLVAIGVATTMFNLACLRWVPLVLDSQALNEASGGPVDHRLGKRYRDLTEAFTWIRQNSPVSAVVQINPDRHDYAWGLQADRPALAFGFECASYSGRAEECAMIQSALRPMFSSRPPPGALAVTCRAFPLDYLVVTDADLVWRDRRDWVWTEHPVFTREFVRVFACHREGGG
jgi:hypothetical protein